MRMTRLVPVAAVLVLAASGAHAQDAMKSKPDSAKKAAGTMKHDGMAKGDAMKDGMKKDAMGKAPAKKDTTKR